MGSDEGGSKLPDLPTLRGSRRPGRRHRRLRPAELCETESHVEELATLGELMMGAAYADGDRAGIEVVAICEQLKDFVESDLLPNAVERRLDHFDLATFDVEAAVARLSFSDDEDRLALLQLVATVVGADSVMEQGEIAYLDRVARAIGLDPDKLSITLS